MHVVIDSLDVEGLARFWTFALGWTLIEEFLEFDEGVIRSPDDVGLELITVRTTEPKLSKNRVHLDLVPPPSADRAKVINGLIERGARKIDIGQGSVPWDVLADPEGNEFCLSPSGGDGASIALGAICLDAQSPEQQVPFWAAATGWAVEAQGQWGGALRRLDGLGPALTLGPPAAPKSGKGRVHLDVAPSPDGDLLAESDRLVRLGARKADIGQGDVDWVVLADPEGNEFCVLGPR